MIRLLLSFTALWFTFLLFVMPTIYSGTESRDVMLTVSILVGVVSMALGGGIGVALQRKEQIREVPGPYDEDFPTRAEWDDMMPHEKTGVCHKWGSRVLWDKDGYPVLARGIDEKITR